MSKTNKPKTVTFASAEAMSTFKRLEAISASRKAAGQPYYAHEVIAAGLDALQTLDRVKVITFSEETTLQDIVANVVQHAVNEIQEQ